MQYEGVADLMRYELLYAHGGFLAPADSICHHPVDDLLGEACAYTVYENEFLRGQLVSPILAAEPGNPFVGSLIQRIGEIEPATLSVPWKSTGNLFVARMIRELQPRIVIFPSYMFNPKHFEGESYAGDGKIYAEQQFGTTRRLYREPTGFGTRLGLVPRRFVRAYYKLQARKNQARRNW